MSAVMQCDICRAIYEKKYPSKSATLDVNEYGLSKHGEYNNFTMIDCCPKCTKQLLEFVEVLKNNSDYMIYVTTEPVAQTT